MRNKRLVGLVLSFVILISTISLPINAFAEETVSKEITLSVFSNVAPGMSHVKGYYKNNNFYINLKALSQISGARVLEEGEKTVHISTNNGTREYEIFFDRQVLVEKNCEKKNITMPTLVINQEKHISVLHFLRYIGADVQLDNSAVQLKVFVRYNIFDALADCVNSNIGNFFWWDEVDYGGKSIEDKLVNAGVVALINKNSNIFKMIFNAEDIARESIEDALISIIQNEGQNSISDNDDLENLNDLNDLYNVQTDTVGMILEAYKSGATQKFGEFIDEFSSVSSFASSASINILNAVEAVKQFDNISEAQVSLLQNTILRHGADSPLLCGEWNVVLAAAKNVNARVQSTYANTYSASYDMLEITAYDTLKAVTEAKDPILLAWDGAIAAMKLIPYTSNMIDKKTQLHNGYNCSIIQCIANELFVKAYSDLYYNDYFYAQPSSQLEHLNQMKSSLILQYKATLTTREYLIASRFLSEEYETYMHGTNKETAILLNKLENCKIVCVGQEPLVEEDLSWIEVLSTTSSSKLSLIQEDVYDTDGNPLHSVRYAYNNQGWLQGKTIWEYKADYDLWDVQETTSYSYNGFGLLIQEIWCNNHTNKITDYKYDENGNLTEKSYGSQNELEETCIYTYDENGLLKSTVTKWYGDGNEVLWEEAEEFFYDVNGRCTHSVLDGIEDFGMLYTYDSNGNLIKEDCRYGESSSEWTHTYNEENQCISSVFSALAGTSSTKYTYTYDDYGNKATCITEYSYLAAYGGPHKEKTVYIYDYVQTDSQDGLWKQLYKKYIEDELPGTPEETSFYLTDMNNDYIPELFIDFGVYSEGMKLCTFDGANVNSVQLRGWGSVSYIAENGLVCNSSGHHGMFEDQVYRIADGQIAAVVSGSWTDPKNMGGYIWDGERVTKEDYGVNLNAVFPKDMAIPLGNVHTNENGVYIFGPNVYSQQQILSLLSEP